jgi:hypothetical protein
MSPPRRARARAAWKWLRGQLYTMLGMIDVPTPPIYGMTAAQVQGRATK